MASDSKFSVGDIVEFKTWEEMTREFGDPLHCRFGFIESMRELCGKIFRITSVYDDKRIGGHGTCWNVSTDMVKLCAIANPPLSPVIPPYSFCDATTDIAGMFSPTAVKKLAGRFSIEKLPSFATLRQMQAKIDELVDAHNKK